MRSPIVAMLWENWRLTRVEAGIRLGLGIVAASAALVMFDASATVAFWILIAVHGMVWLSIAKLNGGRFMDGYKPGFPLYLLYSRPVPTSVFVGVAVMYNALSCAALYLVSAALVGVGFGQPLPLFSVAAWILVGHLCYACVQWSTTNRVGQYVGSFVSLFPLFLLLRNRVASPLQVEFTFVENALLLLIGIVAFGLTVAGVARQRSGGAVVSVVKTAVSGGYPDWLLSLFRFPCPTSSATRAQVWFELKSSGLPVLAIGLTFAILTPLVFAISVPVHFVRPVAAGFAVFSVPIVLFLAGNAFGIRRKQGRTYASTFETTQPFGTAQLAALKVLVRSSCVLAALIAVSVSVWTSTSFVSAWGPWINMGMAVEGAPGLTIPRNAIGHAIGALTGYAPVALAVLASIAVLLMVASLATFTALRARYSRRVIVTVSLLLFAYLALVLVDLAGQYGIVSTFLVDAIFSATSWIAKAAMLFATVYLFWNSFAERVLTVRYACGVFVILAAFGAAWLTLRNAAGAQLAMLWPLLLPLIASILAPWSLSRLRHA